MDKVKTVVLILAAGRGTRMKSDLPKVLHPLAGRPLVGHVVETAKELSPEKIVVVVGYMAQSVKDALRDEALVFAEQKEQRGTGHAVMQAESALASFEGNLLVLSGDVPLVRADTLRELLALSGKTMAHVALLTAEAENPYGYGRIVRGVDGEVQAIVEERDATPNQKMIKEINGGIYVFDSRFLFDALRQLAPDNEQNEFYLTDVVKIALRSGNRVAALRLSDTQQISGVNRPEELEEINRRMMAAGGKN